MLARLGPSRSCIIALCRRSAQVSSEASGITSSRMRKIHLNAAVSRVQRIQSTALEGVVVVVSMDGYPRELAKRSWIGRASRPQVAPRKSATFCTMSSNTWLALV